MGRLTVLSLAFLAATVVAQPLASAHGGGLDRNGGHHDRRRGGYHCHRDPCREPADDSAERDEEDSDESEDRDSSRRPRSR